MSAANAIGTGAVVITANADGLQSGLIAAGAKVDKWAGQVSKKGGEDHGGGIIGRVIGFAKSHPIATAAIATFAAVSVAAHDVLGSVNELGAVGRSAGALGIDSGQYMGIADGLKKIGIEGDAIPGLFAKMGKNVSEAADAGGSDLFRKMGINAKELVKLPLDEQMKSVAEAISELPAGAEQAAAAMGVFGKSGAALLPFLQKGSEGIQEFINDAKKVGVAISQADMEKIQSAKLALSDVGDTFEGFWNKITVIASPVIELVAVKLTKAFEAIAPIMDVAGGFVDGAFFLIAEAITFAIETATEFLSSIGLLEDGTTDWAQVTKDAGHLAIDIFGGVAVVASALWEVLKVGGGVMAYVGSFLVDGLGAVYDLLSSVLDLLKELPDELRPDFLDSMIAASDELGKSLHDAADEMRAWGDHKFDDAGNSFERTAEWAGGLHDKFDNSKKPKAAKPIAEAIAEEVAAPKFAAAIQANTQDFYRISAQSQFGVTDGKDVAATQRDILKEGKSQTALLGKVVAALEDPPEPGEVM